MAKSLRFIKLELEGFGPYQKKTLFFFEEGINTYVAENETGKSTMVYGLLAVLFGLPHGSTSEGFDFTRFKNLKGDRHEGELLVKVNEVIYKIRRNFQNHEVNLWTVNELGEDNMLLEGEHNPRATKPFKAYGDFLVKTLGIGERSLFEDTFLVGQPLPEATAISGSVQNLIIGNRGNSLSSLLYRLADQLKTVTKYTGPKDLGITARNMSKDGSLENRIQIYDELKQKYQQGIEAAEHLVEVQTELSELQKKISEDKKLLNDQKESLEAWKTWESLKSAYERSSSERTRIQKLFSKIQEKGRLKEELNLLIQRDYGVFNDSGGPLKEDLRLLISEYQQEEKLRSSIEEKQIEKQQMQQKMEKMQQTLQVFEGWTALGTDPVEKLKTTEKTFQHMKDLWQRLNNHQERLEGLKQLLENEYLLFEKEDPQTLKLIENYREEHLTRITELERAENALKAEEYKFNMMEDRKERFRKDYNELLDISEEVISGINEKIHLIQQEKKLQQRMLQEKGEKKSGTYYPPLSGGLLAGVGWVAFNIPGGILGLIMGFLVGFIMKKRVEKSGEITGAINKEANNLKKRIHQVDNIIGEYRTYDSLELTRLTEILKQKKRDEKNLEEELKKMDSKKLQELEKSLSIKKQRFNDFDNLMAPYKEAFEAPGQSFTIWKKHKETIKNLQKEIETIYQRVFSNRDADVFTLAFEDSVKDQEWRTVFEILLLIDWKDQFTEAMSVTGFFEKIQNLNEGWWKEAQEKAKEYYELLQQTKPLEHHLTTMDESLQDLEVKRNKLKSNIEALELKWGKPLKAYQEDPEKTLKSYEYRLEKEGESEQLEKDINNLLEGEDLKTPEALENLLSLKNDEAGIALGKWQDHIEKFTELPDLSEEYDRRALADKREILEERTSILKSCLEKSEAKKLDLRGEKAALEGVNPINLAATELELQEMDKEIKKLEFRKKALVVAYQEMDKAIKEYQETYQKSLEKTATAYCRGISGNEGRSISFRNHMEIRIKEEGRVVPIQRLSKGAKDQVFLSLRFAISDLLSEEMKIPFIFDDPFVGTDEKRLTRIKETIEKEQGERQIFVLSHQSQYRNWGKEVEITRQKREITKE